MDKENLGGKVRRLREERALNKAGLAVKAGLAAVNVGRTERGESYPRPPTRRHLAEAMGVDPKELLREDRST